MACRRTEGVTGCKNQTRMLQFITHPSDKYTIPEEVQMALEGGCRWIQLRMKDASDEEFKATALEIIPMCREVEAFLIFDDRVELTRELEVHGVHLGKEDMSPREARELLGPGAIIGVTANTADDIIATRGIDIDYIGLGPYRETKTKAKLSPILGLDGLKNVVEQARYQGIETPIVAIGGIRLEDVDPIMNTGVNGIAMSGAIINSDDPMLYTGDVMKLLIDRTDDRERARR